MNSPSELNPKTNKEYRFLDKYDRSTLIIILVITSIIISVCGVGFGLGTHIRMNAVVDDMADIKSGYEVNIRNMVEANSNLKMEVRLLQQKVDTFNAKVNANEDH